MASVSHSTARASLRAKNHPGARARLSRTGQNACLLRNSDPPHPDAEILALELRREEMQKIYDQLLIKVGNLEDIGTPDYPADIYYKSGDFDLGLLNFTTDTHQGNLWYYSACTGIADRSWPRHRNLRTYLSSLIKSPRSDGRQSKTELRVAQIIDSFDQYQAHVKAAQDASGYTEIDRISSEFGNQLRKVERSIEVFTPKTLQGLHVKAQHLIRQDEFGFETSEEVILFLRDVVRISNIRPLTR